MAGAHQPETARCIILLFLTPHPNSRLLLGKSNIISELAGRRPCRWPLRRGN
jgi:hypothetical protein